MHTCIHSIHTYARIKQCIYCLYLGRISVSQLIPFLLAGHNHNIRILHLTCVLLLKVASLCFALWKKLLFFFFFRVFANHFANRSSLTMRLNSHMSILQGECHHVKPGKTRVLDVITCELVVNISTAESCTIFKTFF